ncbi:MAG: VPLPA-CTERM sorting domain-containing protein [Paracoccaceae bacterium]
MNKFNVLGAAAAIVLVSGAANALTINFDDPGDGGVLSGGNPKTYTVQGYQLTPVKLQNGLCADSKCAIENGQTNLPTLTRLDGGAFNLESFYFLNTGNGQDSDNFVSVQGLTGNETDGFVQKSGAYMEFRLDDLLASFLPGASVNYAIGGSDPACTFLNTLNICKNTGYTVSFLAGLFDDITKVTWFSAGDAQARLDDIVVTQVAVVPLPAGVILLVTGIGGLGAVSRKRRRKS